MKKLIWVFSFLIVMTAYMDEARSFEYNDHGKHDPFWPLVSATGAYVAYDGEMVVADIVLEGIVVDALGNNMAIINGKIVKPTDKIGAYVVETIANDHVDLLQGQERLSVKLKKGKV